MFVGLHSMPTMLPMHMELLAWRRIAYMSMFGHFLLIDCFRLHQLEGTGHVA